MVPNVYFFLLSFTYGSESGLAIVIASSERQAFQCLKSQGRYSSAPALYSLVRVENVGAYYEGGAYGLMLESYTNAMVAFDALCAVMKDIVGPPGPQGPEGPQGPKGDKGDSVDAYTRDQVDTMMAAKQNLIADLAAIRSGANAGATAVQPSELSVYAKTADVASTYETKAAAALLEAELINSISRKQDLLVSGQNIKTVNGESLLGSGDIEVKGGGLVEVTYSELVSLRDGGSMVPGTYYRITDYVATTTDANSRSANHPFDIIVQALSNDTLSEEASAAMHEGDTYFANSKLDAWELKYCLDNNTTRFNWADTENGKGVVYRLRDEFDNDVPYDFKGIQFKRFYVESVAEKYTEGLGPLVGLPVALSGTNSTGLVAGESFKWYYTFSVLGETWDDEVEDASITQKSRATVFNCPEKTNPRTLNNNVFANGPVLMAFLKSFDGTTQCELNSISVNVVYDGETTINNSVFGTNANVFTMSQYRGNTIVGMHRHMDYGTDAQFNTIFLYYDFAHSHMGHYFHRNVLVGRSAGCNFYDTNFYENYIYAVKSCQDNVFGPRFRNNTIVLSTQLTCCTFGADCTNNTFNGSAIQISDFSNCVRYCTGEGFYTNGCRFGEQINYCTFNGRFRGCSFGNYMYYVQFNGGTSPNTFHGVDVSGTILGTSATSLLVIDSPYFLSDSGTGVQRRITIRGDADGNLVATWMDDGVLTGIQKAPSDADWSPLPSISVNAVEYVEQTLTDAQKTQARTNIGAGTYSKSGNGIPETDLAQAVVDKLNAEEIFIATYGTTTQAQVQAAASAGKVVVCFYGSRMYVYAGESAAGYSQFTSVLYDKAYRVYLKNSSWGSASYDLPIDAVLYTTQNLSDAQKSVARGNIGAGTYSKPDDGIPASDIAAGVIPDVSQFVTKSVNDLVNYYTKSQTYTQTEVNSLIGAIQQFHYEIVATLPATGAGNILYLLGPTGSGADKYEEYVYANSTWTKIGDTSIDLSGYVTTTALNTALADYTTTANLTTLLAGKQDTISDLATIRSGAAAGATAYQKPSGGIPEADLASAVTAKLNATEIFWATYGTTTYEDVYAAYTAGKLCACVYSDKCYVLSMYTTDTNFYFTSGISGRLWYVRVGTNNSWFAGSYVLELTENKTSDVAGNSTSTSKYPNTKAVADYIASKELSDLADVSDTAPTDGQALLWDGTNAEWKPGTVQGGGGSVTDVTVGGTSVVNQQGVAEVPEIPEAVVAQELSIDSTPTANSANLVTSGGVASAIAVKYTKPAGGIPASDLASGVIPSTYAGSPSAGGPANKALGIPYGAVDSTSTATVITATVDNFPTTLVAGVCAYIRNDVVASASGWTLNINGTGALPVYASNADASRVTTLFSAATTFLFVYNPTRVSGGCWDMYFGYNANDNTIGYMLRTNGAVPPTASKFYRYRLLFTSDDNQSLIPANTSSSTNATAARAVNQAKINPLAPIYYYSSTSAVEAGVSPGASYMWLQYSGIVLGYSFNRTRSALTMTAKDPVFLKCAPQADGSAIMDADTPIVQALPSTENGKIYIYLGIAESATAITLYYWHPIYWYKDGAIRQWTNAAASGTSAEALSSSEIQTIWNSVFGAPLISFTINDTTYQAEEGMTWDEWVSSAYNTGGFRSDGDTVRTPASDRIRYNGSYVSTTDIIIDGGIYID